MPGIVGHEVDVYSQYCQALLAAPCDPAHFEYTRLYWCAAEGDLDESDYTGCTQYDCSSTIVLTEDQLDAVQNLVLYIGFNVDPYVVWDHVYYLDLIVCGSDDVAPVNPGVA